MADDMQLLIAEVADLKRRLANVNRVGSVHEVKAANGEQKIRVKIGVDSDGKPMLSPWLFTSNQRGQHREEHKYDVGQNVMLMSPDGDFSQALVTPHSESNKHQRPDHATDEHETYQFDTTRETKGDDFKEAWLAKESSAQDDSQQQGGQGGQQGGQQQSKKLTDSDSDSLVLVRMGEKPQTQQGQSGQQQQKRKADPKGIYLIKAKDKIAFQVGGSSIEITTGEIKIKSAKVTVIKG